MELDHPCLIFLEANFGVLDKLIFLEAKFGVLDLGWLAKESTWLPAADLVGGWISQDGKLMGETGTDVICGLKEHLIDKCG